MFQHEESDEEDYEGYFLQPVNGYDIAERIKSANKELFESSDVQTEELTEVQRKVSFRSEPDYEPEQDTEPELDDATCDDDDDDDVAAINQVLDRRDDIVIEEQEVIKMNKEEGERCTPDQISNIVVVNEVDEICEEIIDFTVSDEVNTTKNGQQLNDEPLITEHTKPIVNNNSATNIRQKVTKDSKSGKLRGQQPKPSSAKVKQTESNHHHQHNHRPNSSVMKQSSEQFLKIQLNFKPCCEYKHLENDRLPRYCGYISQYGLSKEQLERREKRRERFRNRQSDKTAKQLQEETMKSEVNEEAFARWLQNKMRNSRSMTKNMYDYRPTKQTTTKGKKV